MSNEAFPTAILFFEDLVPGRELDLGTLIVEGMGGDVDIELAAAALERSRTLGALNECLVEVRDLHWTFRRRVETGTEVALVMQVTNRQLDDDDAQGVVGRRFTLATLAGDLVQEGTSLAVVRTRSGEVARAKEEANPSFASPAWLRALVESLGESREFAEATASYDGSIALDFGAGSLGVRIYRGRIIDQGRAVAANATFTVVAPPSTWLRFAARPRNEFISFAMGDAFEVRGSTYDYLRMTRALMVMTDEVRSSIARSRST